MKINVKNVGNQRIIRNFKEKLSAEFQKAVKLMHFTLPVGPLKTVLIPTHFAVHVGDIYEMTSMQLSKNISK
jgi:hypothetical protein